MTKLKDEDLAPDRVVILIRSQYDCEAKIYSGDDPEYQFRRRIEKDGFEAESVYIAQRVLPEVVERWRAKYHEDQFRWEREDAEARERREFERLKKKYEQGT